MDKKKIKDQLVTIISKETQVSQEDILNDPNLENLSSLSRIEVLFEIEEAFGIEVPNDDIEKFDSLENVVNEIYARIQVST